MAIKTAGLRRVPRILVPITLATTVLVFATEARAQDEGGWRLRVDFGFFDPGGAGILIDTGTATFQSDFDGGGGVGVRGEYRWSRRMGVEAGFFSGASVDVGFSGGTSTAEISSFTVFAPGLDVHLTPEAKVDLYVGPQLALVNYSDLTTSVLPGFVGSSISVDSDVGFGAILGLDIPVGERNRWTFQTNLRYFDAKMNGVASTTRLEADFHRTIFSLGFGYRF